MSKYKAKFNFQHKTELGKISNAKFGFGGYQDCQIGLSLTFDLKGSGVMDFISGGWAPGVVDPDKYTTWTESDRKEMLANMATTISHILVDAQADQIVKLIGKPVEVKTDEFSLISWRILTEVL